MLDLLLFHVAGESSAPAGTDPIAMMEFYVKKAAHEERRRQPRYSKDEMPPPASLQGYYMLCVQRNCGLQMISSYNGLILKFGGTAAISKKGHHMGDYIPPVELEKFLSTCNDAASRKAAKEAAERAKIQADNVGHKLLSKMGWKEGFSPPPLFFSLLRTHVGEHEKLVFSEVINHESNNPFMMGYSWWFLCMAGLKLSSLLQNK